MLCPSTGPIYRKPNSSNRIPGVNNPFIPPSVFLKNFLKYGGFLYQGKLLCKQQNGQPEILEGTRYLAPFQHNKCDVEVMEDSTLLVFEKAITYVRGDHVKKTRTLAYDHASKLDIGMDFMV